MALRWNRTDRTDRTDRTGPSGYLETTFRSGG